MRITVFGLGTIGSNLLIQLVRQYPDFEYVGIDYDKVEERNLRIQAYFKEQVNQPKTRAIQTVAQRYVRKFKYTARNEKIDHRITRPEDNELFIDCFDNTESRRYLTLPGKHDILHLGFSPAYTAEFVWNESYTVPGAVDPNLPDICALHDAIPFVHFFINAALLQISEFIESGHRKNFLVTKKTKLTYL